MSLSTQQVRVMLLCLVIISGYAYTIDLPQSCQTPLSQSPFNFSPILFNLLYFSSFVVVLGLVPIGRIVEGWGIQKGLLAVIGLGIVAQVISRGILQISIICIQYYVYQNKYNILPLSLFLIAYPYHQLPHSQSSLALLLAYRPPSYIPLLYLFRGLVGLSGSLLYVLQGNILSKLISQPNYDTVIGICMTLPFLFDSFSCWISPVLYVKWQNMGLVWGLGVAGWIVAGLAALVVVRMMKNKDKNIQNRRNWEIQDGRKTKENGNIESIIYGSITQGNINQGNKGRKDNIIYTKTHNQSLNESLLSSEAILSVNIVKHNNYTTVSQLQSKNPTFQSNPLNLETPLVTPTLFQLIKALPLPFWLLFLFQFIAQCCIGTFIDNCTDYLINTLQYDYQQVAPLMILPYSMMVVGSIAGSWWLGSRNGKGRRLIIVVGLGIYMLMLIVIELWGRLYTNNLISNNSYFNQGDSSTSALTYLITIVFLSTFGICLSIQYSIISPSLTIFSNKQNGYVVWSVSGSAFGIAQAFMPLINMAILEGSAGQIQGSQTNAMSHRSNIGTTINNHSFNNNLTVQSSKSTSYHYLGLTYCILSVIVFIGAIIVWKRDQYKQIDGTLGGQEVNKDAIRREE